MVYRAVLCVLLALLASTVGAADRVDLGRVGGNSEDVSVAVLESNDTRTVVRFELEGFFKSEVLINGQTYNEIKLDTEPVLCFEGQPALPHVSRAIIIPDNAKMRLKVISSDYTDFPETPVVPSKGLVPPSVKLDEVPYTFGAVYQSSGWYPSEVVAISPPFILRDYRGTVIDLFPFQYEPQSQTLRVYTSVTVEVLNVGPGESSVLSHRIEPLRLAADFDLIYQRRFINYDFHRATRQAAAGAAYTPLADFGEMLIIVYDDFYDSIAAFAEWKLQKGIKTTVVRVSETYGYVGGSAAKHEGWHERIDTADFAPADADTMPSDTGRCCYGNPYDPDCDIISSDSCAALGGSWIELPFPWYTCGSNPMYDCVPLDNSNGIKEFIKDFYNSHPDLVWVLLVGRSGQVSTPILIYNEHGKPHEYAADPYYSLMADIVSDYPDIIVGRFPGETAEEIHTMVERTIEYERDLPLPGDTDLDWYHRGSVMAAAEDPQADTGTMLVDFMENIAQRLEGFTYSSIDRIYETEGWSTQDFDTALNAGKSIVNYAGHGGRAFWGQLHEEIFTKTDIERLQNANKLPCIMSFACTVAPIDDPITTFGEKWLQVTDAQGEPTGAMGTYMSSVVQYWSPCNIALNEFNLLLVSGANTTFGALCYNGGCKMKDQAGGLADRMFAAWHILGDPSLQVRTATPLPLTVTPTGELEYGATELSVSVVDQATSQPVESALCAIYYQPPGSSFEDGTLFGAAYTDVNGTAVVPIGDTLPIGENVLLTVTGFNLEASVQQVPVTYDLVILTTPLPNTNDTTEPGYEVRCEVYSTSTLIENSPVLYYHTGDSVWQTVYMTPDGDEYSGYIPPQPPGTEVSYYIWAKNEDMVEYQTETYTFVVYEYHVSLAATDTSLSGPDGVVVSYEMQLINEGALEDSYDLTVVNNSWPVTIWNQAGDIEITNSGTVLPNDTFMFKVRVVVDDDMEGGSDDADIVATSVASVTVDDTLTLTTTSEGPCLPVPFVEHFETDQLSEERWQPHRWIVIDTFGIDEPSTPYSVHLGSGCTFPQAPIDTITSRMINLPDEANIVVSYYFQCTGNADSPEEGDDLFVEYLDDSGEWKQLRDPHPGSGDDMTTFEQVEVSVPPDGYHCRFRLRFYHVFDNSGDSLFQTYLDDWFVDDISIDYAPPCCSIRGDIDHNGKGPNVVDLTYFVDYLFNGGPEPPCPKEADVDGSGGDPNVADLTYLVEYLFQGGPPPVPCP